ncbi:TetR family transcriptional regulator [Streptomyces sp. SID14478]|uniref:TetR/AcrR family transcriptional regulator n=1 Tax=Streptomyces sp. SID14478 TaxID=2706073 RepID=UPI0013DA9984|nr:TetR/AcrR family transcriptional regulator C-terminal domain-containing protein [Streptomyces sp. SID14478]NEB73833.1 TetR family transcriptional regulator [Streptomyces sp. SID14478]
MAKPADRAKQARMSVWLDESPNSGTRASRSRRSEQPSGLDRERITEATVRLLDAEGLAKFSMRRLAGELGVTAMSVYWYVDTKDDLLELALDRIFGEMVVPGPQAVDAGDWRDHVRELAATYRALIVRHPWCSAQLGNYLNIGPNSLEFSRAVQRVIAATGLSLTRQRGAIASVFQFVYGYGTIEGHFRQRCADAGMSQDEYFHEAMSAFRVPAEMAEDFRHAEDMRAAAEDGQSVEEMRDADFQVALDLLVAGIEALVAQETRTS